MSGLLARYEALVAAGELRADPDQRSAAEALGRLQEDLEASSGSGLCLSCIRREPYRCGFTPWRVPKRLPQRLRTPAAATGGPS